MDWSPMLILPQDVDPVQFSVHIPFNEILSGIQFYQADLYRGIGAYNIGQYSKTGKARTKAESQMDAAESAKLQGTQIRRFNDNQTRWMKLLYKRMSRTKRGGNGYKLKEKFIEFMEDNGVPEEAWKWENIDNIESNMLNGSGSPSYKLMAAQQTVSLTGMTPMNKGQENAIADAIAALNGRQNVNRYVKQTKVDIPDEQGIISMENIGMTDPKGNPANFRVYPDQNHVEHFQGHFQDAAMSLQEAQAALQSSGANPQAPTRGQVAQSVSDEAFNLMRDIYACLMRFKGPHLVAHLGFIQKDPGKKNMAKQFGQQMQQLQRGVDELGSQVSQIEQKRQQDGQQGQGMSPEDIKLHALVAKEAIQTDSLKKKEDIKLAAMAQKAHLHNVNQMEKASTDLATKRAKAANDIQIHRAKASHNMQAMQDQHEQEMQQSDQQNAQEMAAQQQAIAQQEQITTQNPEIGQQNG
jgi:hypothetical protein